MDWLGFRRINLSNAGGGGGGESRDGGGGGGGDGSPEDDGARTRSHIVCVALFREVTNSASLRSALLDSTILNAPDGCDDGNSVDLSSIDVVLVKASLVLDATQAVVAANKAILARDRGKMTTRSLGAEVLFYLATGSKNITESLKRFGVGDDDADLLCLMVAPGGREDSVEVAERRLASRIAGRMARCRELSSASSDLEAVARAHRLKAEEKGLGRDDMASLLVSKSASKDITA